ncbi:MAG: hypothetical protein U5Q44_08550 [Dehalococcoidia bacterium]|nr:hypothetical protein [Dehalococcoidia bacterium]
MACRRGPGRQPDSCSRRPARLPLVPAAWRGTPPCSWAREELHRDRRRSIRLAARCSASSWHRQGSGYAAAGAGRAPIDILAAWFTGGWSHPTAGALLLLYSWPLLLAGFAGALLFLLRPAEEWGAQADRLLVAWFGAGLLLLLASAGSSAEAPLVAATIPAAFLAAFAIARLAPALGAVSNTVGPWALAAGSLFLLTLAGAVIIDWARQDAVGAAGEVAYTILVLAGALALLVGIFRWREARAVAVVPLAFIAAIPWIAGGVNVATSATNEPLPAPLSAFEGRVVHHLAHEAAAEHDGPIVLHPDLEGSRAWACRGSRTLARRLPRAVRGAAAGHLARADLDDARGPHPPSRDSWALARAVEPPHRQPPQELRPVAQRPQARRRQRPNR